MIELTERLAPGAGQKIDAQLPLTYELRQKRWLRARLSDGEEVQVKLPRGETLRGGDRLAAADGRVIEVVAMAEPVVQALFNNPSQLIRAAYHLGNRHAPAQIGAGYLRLQENHVLEALLEKLGATLIRTQAAFEPESGAYASGHSHDGGAGAGGAKIHEYAGDESEFAKR